MVHEIEFGKHTDRALTSRVNISCEFERFRVHNIDIRRRDGEDDAIGFRNVLGYQSACLFFNVGGLIANRYFSQAGQIYQGQAEDVRRVDLEVDGLSVDAFVVASNSRRLILDLALHLLEVVESSTGYVIELAPFVLSGYRCGSMRHVDFIVARFVFAVGGYVDELQDERSSSDNAGASREEVAADDVFEH